RRGVRCLFRVPSPRGAPRSVGVAAESGHPRPRLARAGGGRGPGAVRGAGGPGSAASALGGISGRSAGGRVLAGGGLEAAPAGRVWRRRGPLADRTPRAVSEPAQRASRTLPALVALGILNHTVLAGSRITISLYALSLDGSPFVVGSVMGLYSFFPMWLAGGAGRLSRRVRLRAPRLVGGAGCALRG